MQQSYGLHEIHRTFRSQPRATQGYVSLVMTAATPTAALRPRIRVRLNAGRDPQANKQLLLMVAEKLTLALHAPVAIVAASQDEGGECALIDVHPDGRAWTDLVNALAPRDAAALQELDRLFYFS